MDNIKNNKPYDGKILSNAYSDRLQKRVRRHIDLLQRLDDTGIPVFAYLSAWHWNDSHGDIWYEFISTGLTELIGCAPSDAAETMRRCIIDQHVYRDDRNQIHREVADRDEIENARSHLRRATSNKGYIDAVYHLQVPNGDTIWLKDLAVIETDEEAQVCLSLGHLTVVTKEMRAEEERLKREKLEASLEMAGAICHELNQPLQAISGFTEILKLNSAAEPKTAKSLERILEQTDRMGEITKKLMQITRYETKAYLQGVKIVDIDKSTTEEP